MTVVISQSNCHSTYATNNHDLHQADNSGRISPDSGATSMSPGIEGNEGHGQIEDVGDDEDRDTPPLELPVHPQGRINSNGSGHSAIQEFVADRQSCVVPKRVAFRDMPTSIHTGDRSPRTFQRSYTLPENNTQTMFMAAQPVQRTQTVVTYGRGPQSSHQYRNNYTSHQFPRSLANQVNHPPPPVPPRQPIQMGMSYAMSTNHGRLPRVHRGVGYENVHPQHGHPMSAPGGMPVSHVQSHSRPTNQFRLNSAFKTLKQTQHPSHTEHNRMQ